MEMTLNETYAPTYSNEEYDIADGGDYPKSLAYHESLAILALAEKRIQHIQKSYRCGSEMAYSVLLDTISRNPAVADSVQHLCDIFEDRLGVLLENDVFAPA